MPTYTFKRPYDGALTKKKLTFQEYDQIKAGTLKVTDEEGVPLELVFSPGAATFVLKDGPSGGWASKALKENRYRQGHTQNMRQREKDHVFKTKLIPNLNGSEAHSWADVQDEVRSKKGVEAAKTYEPFVAKERAAS